MSNSNSRRGSNSNSGFYVRDMISRLDFTCFQRLVWLWLGASGYQNLRKLARRHRRGRGSISPDFLVQVGENGLEIAVQIRHWRSPLTKRAVDELRGIMLRDEIPAGMIICPSKVSRAARIAAAEFGGRPVRILGLDSLANSLTVLGLCTPPFFRALSQLSLGLSGASVCKRSHAPEPDFATSPEAPPPNWAGSYLAGALIALLVLWFLMGIIR